MSSVSVPPRTRERSRTHTQITQLSKYSCDWPRLWSQFAPSWSMMTRMQAYPIYHQDASARTPPELHLETHKGRTHNVMRLPRIPVVSVGDETNDGHLPTRHWPKFPPLQYPSAVTTPRSISACAGDNRSVCVCGHRTGRDLRIQPTMGQALPITPWTLTAHERSFVPSCMWSLR